MQSGAVQFQMPFIIDVFPTKQQAHEAEQCAPGLQHICTSLRGGEGLRGHCNSCSAGLTRCTAPQPRLDHVIFIFLRTRSRELRPSGELGPPRPLLPPPRPPRLALRLPAGRQ